MLVLTRKPGERILLAGGITIELIEIDFGQSRAKIGISAPAAVWIAREELARTAAATAQPPAEAAA